MLSYTQDGRWSWIVCVSGSLSWLAAMGFVFSFGIFFPVFMDYFRESREKTAWVGSLAIAVIFFSGHASGALINRFGCRVTTLLGGFLCALSLGLSSLAKNILMLYLTYSVLYGLGTSCVFSAGLNIISKYFKTRRSLATGILACGQSGGPLILAPVLQMMIDAFGWQTTYRIMAGVVLLLCLSGVSYSPNVQSNDARDTSVEENTERKGSYIDVSVWKEPKVVAIIVSASVVFFGHFTPQIHLVKYCEEIGIEADPASRLLVYFGLASCTGRLVTGRLCDFKKMNALYAYQVAQLVAGTSIIAVTMATTYSHMVVFNLIYGFCDGAFATTHNVLLMTCVSPPTVPVAIGWQLQIGSFFLASGPPVAGLLADSMNSHTHALYMSGAVVVAGACIPFLLLFAKTKEPAASETWKLNEIKETGSVTMIADAEEEIATEPNSNRITVVFTSSV